MGLQFGLTKDYLFKEMTGFHLIYSVKGNNWVYNSYGIRDYSNLERINVFLIFEYFLHNLSIKSAILYGVSEFGLCYSIII